MNVRKMAKSASKKSTSESSETGGQKKAIDAAIQQIEKQFGKGAIMKFGTGPTQHVEAIPTGAVSLDIALGIGGIPKGRIVEIYGPESSGKTTLAMHMIAEAQAKGLNAAFIDAEHAFDPTYAKTIGINLDELYISQPDYGEQALEILETLVRSAAFGIVVVDSVAALTPKAEIEGDMGDSHMGLQARLMSQALRKITAISAKTGVTIVFLNQLRMKIGVMFGNPETTTGGNALKFYSSVRLDIRKRETLKEQGDVTGHTVRVKVVKNKMAPPFKEATFDIVYPNGIDKYSSLIDAALQFDVVQQAGSWLKKGDTQLGQGKKAVADSLREDNKTAKTILEEVKKKAGIA
ncbi:recombinase RecA [Candidatus Dojkabacteria bacterium]|uniref:Protein RecA n=1 Tax=Candidatus Dojkabacteria bacterium TaxID=2099670 RepID=A0A955L837_9BACT|nr:recombinase RecA [Candidatus Dojkabacteria bacterium]